MNELNDQGKIELGRFLYELPLFADESDKGCLKMATDVLNKIQELTQNHENNEPEHKNAPSDNTEVGQYQTTGEKHHVCGTCYQSYPVKGLERDFMDCKSCITRGRVRPSCFDKNGKLFTAGDWLKNEKSSVMVQVLQINSDTIYTEHGCFDRQDFIDAGWIVHERVTGFKAECDFEKEASVGGGYCSMICNKNKGFDLGQQWVICELYNKEDEG